LLLPVTDQKDPSGVSLASWRNDLSALWEKHKKLTKKFKDPSVRIIFEVGILCTGNVANLYQNASSVLDRLCKNIKVWLCVSHSLLHSLILCMIYQTFSAIAG
jgi:hypothetical protein